MKIAALILLSLFGLALLLGVGAVIYAGRSDLAPLAQRLARQTLGRDILIESLRIEPGRIVTVELRGLAVPNAEWGEAPHFLSLDHLRAEIEVASLLRGMMRYRSVESSGLEVALERDTEGRGNWEFGAADDREDERSEFEGGLAVIPKTRAQFPILHRLDLTESLVTWRTSGGARLRMAMNRLRIESPGDDLPVSIALDGAYNGIGTQLRGTTASFATMRQPLRPFDTAFTIEAGGARADFRGVINRPLDFGGVQGRLSLIAAPLTALLDVFGAGVDADILLEVSGGFSHDGDRWQLDGARGNLGGNAFTGVLGLNEQGRGKGDEIGVKLDFASLDADAVLGAIRSRERRTGPLSLELDRDAGTARVEAEIGATILRHGRWRAEDALVKARLAPGEMLLHSLRLGIAGGILQASGSARPDAGDARRTRIEAQAMLKDAEAERIAAALGSEGQLSGRLDAGAMLEAVGATLDEARKISRGHAVVSMRDGYVARALLEQASVDLRALFRQREGAAPLDCLLGVATLQNGVAAITPLRLRASGADLNGSGMVDLAGRNLDLVIRSEGKSTGFFALDIPIRISGGFDAVSIRPSRAAPGLQSLSPEVALQALPAELKQLAARSGCAG